MRGHEPVVVPERGPRGDQENESRLQEIGSEQQAADDPDDQPPACTRDSRWTRAGTSR
jgi:hypothetical protein